LETLVAEKFAFAKNVNAFLLPENKNGVPLLFKHPI
jgi:hypothetical protein